VIFSLSDPEEDNGRIEKGIPGPKRTSGESARVSLTSMAKEHG
jgi:hypothetical protein